jgi:hypothetical protein
MVPRALQTAICLFRKDGNQGPIWSEHNTTEATVGLHRRRDEIIQRLVELPNARLGPGRAKHVFYHYWSFA